MKMKEYQKGAVAALILRAKNLLRAVGRKVMVFKSPTGSGKTVMMAEFLARLTTDTIRPLSFIWVAPHDLHKQSRAKLARYYEDSRALDCAYFPDLENKQIGENQILFFNWESVVKENAIITRDNETEFYLKKVLENTRADGRDIVLVIDESHYAADTGLAHQIIAEIQPKLVVEVSATPIIKKHDDLLSVSLDDVRMEGMIKKSVVVNDGLGRVLSERKISLDDQNDKTVLKMAIDRQRELVKAFRAEDSAVNPLLCIQLPDRGRIESDAVYRLVERTLDEKGITTANGKLAIWLSDDKVNWEAISKNDNPVEALLFKHAIALGWDCPRAHILALFRKWSSKTFSAQTLGRIMRMPEPSVGYYNNEILNSGYVYTDFSEVEIEQDVAEGTVHVYSARRIADYDSLALPSVHRVPQQEHPRLLRRFVVLFLQQAEQYKLAKKINRKNQRVQSQLIADYEAVDIDALTGEKITGVSFDVNNIGDLQKLFDHFARDNLSPFRPDPRSIYQVEAAIQAFFGGPLEMSVADHFPEIVKITLSDSNRGHFVNVLNLTKDAYSAEIKKDKKSLEPNNLTWEIAKTATYSENYRREDESAKSAMQPFFAAKNASKPEREFIKFLEKSEKVKWWHKNGESDSRYFAVPYSEYGEERPFYVDFIVRFTDGSVGLYDTKSGFTIDKDKSDGLLAYVKKHSRKGQKLVGGIVAPANPNYKQGWRIDLGEGKDADRENSSKWPPLEF